MARHDDALADLTGTVGQPLPNIEVAILDPRPARCCRSASRARSAPAATTSWSATTTIRRRPRRPSTPRAGCTPATSARWTRAGYFRDHRPGQGDDHPRRRELFPAEIENAMLEHEDIGEVAVVGVPCPVYGEQVACFMRPSGGRRPEPDELKAFIRERLSPQKTPKHWLVGRPMAADRLGQDPEIQARRAVRRPQAFGPAPRKRLASRGAGALVGLLQFLLSGHGQRLRRLLDQRGDRFGLRNIDRVAARPARPWSIRPAAP